MRTSEPTHQRNNGINQMTKQSQFLVTLMNSVVYKNAAPQRRWQEAHVSSNV